MMSFEGKLPVLTNRNYIKTKEEDEKKMEAPPQTTLTVDFLGWHLLVFVEIRFVPFDRELPALSNCEDDPGSHLLFSITGNVSHVVGRDVHVVVSM